MTLRFGLFGTVLILALTLLLALTGCSTDPAKILSPARDFAGPVEIGNGRHLYLQCRGQGGPTVILESGYHHSLDPWNQSDATSPATGPAVLPALAGAHRVCAYDRPGTVRYPDPPTLADRSSPVPMPRTAQDVVRDLHALLDAAHVAGPYVLVGHSLGGLFIRLYAQTYPDQVRGLVFVDAFGIEIPALMGPDWPTYRRELDKPPREVGDSPSFEIVDIDASVTQVTAAPALPAVPAVVITKTEPFAIPADIPAEYGETLERAWRDATADLVALRPQTPHLVATGSDHMVQIHQPDLVAAGVALVIKRAAR